MDEPQVPGQPKPPMPEPPAPVQTMTKTSLQTSVAFFVASLAVSSLMYAVLVTRGFDFSLF